MKSQAPSAPSALAVLRSSSLSQAVYKEIETIILGGSLQPGERLNEKALADRFGVSRGPVREALQALHANGLVEMVPNRGAFVQRISTHEAVEIYDVRAGLFGTACRLLAARIDAVTLAELKALVAQMEAAAKKRDLDAYYPLNLAFHEMIVEQSGNHTLAKTYFGLVGRLHLFRARGLVHGGGFESSNAEHRLIVKALDNRDAIAAFEAGFGHVERAKHRVALSGDVVDATQAPAD